MTCETLDRTRIPCVLMRGGTSKGPFFLASDLPSDVAMRDAVLLEVLGSGHPLQIDGIGGGSPTTSKVAIISVSDDPRADVDYLFAQVRVRERIVDTSPNCGNMLAAVGPFAIESGLVRARDPATLVRIRNVNTNKLIEAKVLTPRGRVVYDGDMAIDGVPGTAAPIVLSFLDAAGSVTNALFPTGQPIDRIDGIEVTCIDCAIPMVLMRATDLGVEGIESAETLSANQGLIARLNRIRIEAGRRMGIGNAETLVIPKPVLIAHPRNGGDLTVRYFMPHDCHPALATTGGAGIATAAITEGTVAHAVAALGRTVRQVTLEHPSGRMPVAIEHRPGQKEPVVGIIRTARRMFEGYAITRLQRQDLRAS
ncbi:MAG: 4-oxalomesaconate tautomerase [Paracoccaceae bacterium]|nr:4-oxalomesaconate tautomerase [Paracoccaceae bacterium]